MIPRMGRFRGYRGGTDVRSIVMLGVFPERALTADRLGPPTGAVHCPVGVWLRKAAES
jgi:hypothetical protein